MVKVLMVILRPTLWLLLESEAMQPLNAACKAISGQQWSSRQGGLQENIASTNLRLLSFIKYFKDNLGDWKFVNHMDLQCRPLLKVASFQDHKEIAPQRRGFGLAGTITRQGREQPATCRTYLLMFLIMVMFEHLLKY